jgi:hypothetical protein
MKNLLAAASAAAILLADAPAFAQAPGAPTPAPGFGIQGDAAAAAPAAADVRVDVIVAALNDPQAEIGKLSSVPADAQIQVVDLNSYLQGDGAATLTPAITAAEGQGDTIRSALEGNAAIQAQLTAQNVNIADVVGFGVDGSTILVFTNASADAGAAAAAPGGAAGAGNSNPALPPGGQAAPNPTPAP